MLERPIRGTGIRVTELGFGGASIGNPRRCAGVPAELDAQGTSAAHHHHGAGPGAGPCEDRLRRLCSDWGHSGARDCQSCSPASPTSSPLAARNRAGTWTCPDPGLARTCALGGPGGITGRRPQSLVGRPSGTARAAVPPREPGSRVGACLCRAPIPAHRLRPRAGARRPNAGSSSRPHPARSSRSCAPRCRA
jgi:hypothetical protein